MYSLPKCRANSRGIQTDASLRIPLVALSTYRCLQLLCQQANDLVRSVLLFLVNFCMSLTVVANNIMIVFHATLPVAAFLVFGTYSFASSLVLFLMYIKLGQVHEYSKGVVRSWKVKPNYAAGEKSLMIKHFTSCRLNRFEMGSVGPFTKPTSIRIVAKIIFYTVKFLMLMRPHGKYKKFI